MRCLVTGGNVSVIARAIHALSRIGEECYLEALDEGLALRTVNSSRSAFACFLLAPLFFQKYEAGILLSEGDTETSGSQVESFRCKIVMKSILAVFKSPSSLEKTVEKCKMFLGRSSDRLVIQLLCKHGIIKTHNLSIQDCETLQAVYTKEACPNMLRAQPKLLAETVVHFPTNQEEVTLDVKARRVSFRNYIEPDSDPKKMMLTEMTLTPQEFDDFCVREESEITFCLKELRGLLGFAETSALPVTVHFKGPGSPAIFSLQETVLEVNFVLATLADTDSQGARQAAGGNGCPTGASRADDDFMSEEIDSYMIAMETSAMEEMLAVGNQTPVEEGDLPPSPTFPLAHLPKRSHGDNAAPIRTPEADEDAEVTATPPHKKQFRSLFFGSLLSPVGGSCRLLVGHEVLAEASDSDGET